MSYFVFISGNTNLFLKQLKMSEDQLPQRDYMDNPKIQWRHEKPDFSKVDKKYVAEKIKNHKAGSLEKIVENLVKTWEMESSHKIREEVSSNSLYSVLLFCYCY